MVQIYEEVSDKIDGLSYLIPLKQNSAFIKNYGMDHPTENIIVKKQLNKSLSYKQIFNYLSKYKKARVKKDGVWEPTTMLKYIEELTKSLDV